MASIKQIGITRELAIYSMRDSIARIRTVHSDIQELVITAWRDPAYNEAMQMQAIAEWIKVLADKIAPVSEIQATETVASEEAVDPTPKRGRKKAE